VSYICNPSYSGGRDQEDHSSKPAWANSSRDPISIKPITKKGWWSGSSPSTAKKEKKFLENTYLIIPANSKQILPMCQVLESYIIESIVSSIFYEETEVEKCLKKFPITLCLLCGRGNLTLLTTLLYRSVTMNYLFFQYWDLNSGPIP
jgi:hypothetical protein